MGYVISYEALRDIYGQLAPVVSDTMNERIPKINEVLTEFVDNNKIQGKTAETIKKYMIESHGVILAGISYVSQQLLSKFILYQDGYYDIDSNRDTVIDENFVNFIDDLVKDFIKKESELKDNFKIHTNAISDIYNANAPQDWNIKSFGAKINRKNENLHTRIISYESRHKNGLSDVEELICSLKNTIESCQKNLGGFDIPNNDLTIVKENIYKAYEFQIENSAEINSAFSNQQAILEEIWTEEQAKIRKKEGIWQCVSAVGTVVVGGAAIVFSGGAATPIVLGTATVLFGTSNAIEGGQNIYYGSVGDISSESFNPLRDTVFLGNQDLYDFTEFLVTFAAGASIPLTHAVNTGKVITTADKAKLIAIEFAKEAAGTAGGFAGVWFGEQCGLSQDQSMFLGIAASILTSKGADWVDNNFDNLALAGKYTFNNQGKTVTLGCNGGNIINDFCDNFTDIKNGKINRAENIIEGVSKPKPYSKNRPSYRKGQVDEVWENAKDPLTGKVYDPTGKEITWDKTKPRNGQWDMGHIPGEKYSEMHKLYMDGTITKKEFLEWYKNPKNYRPELPSTNRSHKYE